LDAADYLARGKRDFHWQASNVREPLIPPVHELAGRGLWGERWGTYTTKLNQSENIAIAEAWG